MNRVTAFVDTVVFLHYEMFDQVDWRQVTGASEVALVVAPVVIRELDEQKDGKNATKRSKERARKVLNRLLHLWVGELLAPLGEGVTIRYLPSEPSLDFAAYGLSRDWRDDQLLAAVIQEKNETAEAEVVLVTRDVGPELKAKHHKIRTIRLPKKYELNDEPTPETRRIQELEQRLQAIEGALPDLSLQFRGGGDSICYEVPRPLARPDDDEIAIRLAPIKKKYPKRGSATPNVPPMGGKGGLDLSKIALSSFVNQPTPSEIKRYNEELDQFYADCETFLRADLDYEEQARLIFAVEIDLVNGGSAPAEDIDVFLHFPDGFELLREDALPEQPDPPSPPQPPRSSLDMTSWGLSHPVIPDFSRHLRPPEIGPPPNVSPPRIRETDSYDVGVTVGRVKHRLVEELPDLYVAFASDEAVRPFRVDYRLITGSPPGETEGSLNVRFNRP